MHVVVVFVVGDGGEQVRARHRDLDGLAGEGGDGLEFVDQAEVDRVEDRAPADRGGMKNVRIVLGDRLRLGLALKRGDLLPEVIEHRVRRRMPVVRPAMHFAAGDDIDAGDLLLKDRGLGCPQLRVGEIARGKLAQRYQPVQRLIPSRHAVRADDGRRVFLVLRHCPVPFFVAAAAQDQQYGPGRGLGAVKALLAGNRESPDTQPANGSSGSGRSIQLTRQLHTFKSALPAYLPPAG